MAKEERILALEQELEAANKLAEENASSRKAAEEQMVKMRHDLNDHQKQKRDEHKKFIARAQRAVTVYRDLLESVSEETEAPRNAPIADFMEWLANKLATVSDYMTIRQEYASFESIRAFAQALEEYGCDHL